MTERLIGAQLSLDQIREIEREHPAATWDVLGWCTEIADWVHLFTWTHSPIAGLRQAENDNSRFGCDYQHFCILPVLTEKQA